MTPKRPKPALTERQTLVLQLVANGLKNVEIGEATGIEPGSVERRLTVIYQRLKASNRAHAVAIALRRGLIT